MSKELKIYSVVQYESNNTSKTYILVVYEHYNYIDKIDRDVVGFHNSKKSAKKHYHKVVDQLRTNSTLKGLQAIRYHVRLYCFPSHLENDLHSPKTSPLDFLNHRDSRVQQYVMLEEWIQDPNFTYS